MSRGLTLTMAVACAFTVANLYYNQPLLALIARDFGVTEAQVGAVPTSSQVGYALGVGLLVPLGDITERRRLILLMLGLVSASLVAMALAPTLLLLTAASLAVGLTTVVPQMLLPFAVHLTAPGERGRTVGTVVSGLLLGILLSRTVAGFVGAGLGWRAMFWIAAGLMLALAVVLRLLLPESRPESHGGGLSYAGLLRSVARLGIEQPILREAAVSGALVFGAFSAFWATLVFHLSSPQFHLGPQAAGLFGLIGAVGALAAPVTGRLADRKSPRFLVGVATAVILASYVVFRAAGAHLWGLIIGVLLLDLGVQAAQVSNQTRVYGLIPGASSRLNTVYMVSCFVGGSAGSLLGSFGWNRGGWGGVCLAGGGMAALALLAHLLAARSSKAVKAKAAAKAG
jgi:predicted MFS family arabinose efflux permease